MPAPHITPSYSHFEMAQQIKEIMPRGELRPALQFVLF